MNENEYWSNRSNLDRMYGDSEHQSRLNAAIEAEEINLFALLKPTLVIDGDKWCCLYGEDLQVGIAGFGDSPIEAIRNWNKEWYLKIKRV